MANLPETQHAVQLVGPDKLVLNTSKKVLPPGPHQILCRIEVVGLCFSDLKLLKQFSSHVRKSQIASGIDLDILKEVPCYVPDQQPTVPGHETTVRIEAVGSEVKDFKPGQRYLAQADYRWLRTASSGAAFGYNFEGALQEYVLMDQRVITSPEGESMLIPASEQLPASAIALVEPWACVEDAYVSGERQQIKTDGHLLIVADVQLADGVLADLFNRYSKPAKITWVSNSPLPAELDGTITSQSISQLTDLSYDDIIYFGSDAKTTETLFAKVAAKGLFNIVLSGGKFGKDIPTPVGRVHYGGVRIVGTTGSDPSESMQYIPPDDEIRPGDKINVVGAGGPMGMMHVIRNICQDTKDVSVFAADLDDDRLAVLSKIAAPLAEKNKVNYKAYNPTKDETNQSFDYTALMAPIPALVSASVHNTAQRGLINLFAGIPTTVTAQIDLDSYIKKQLYFIGTSGSVIEDMHRVLTKVISGKLDTNVSVAAICGLAGAINGIRAVESRSIPGKIVVYPACRSMGLIRLEELPEKMPQVAQHLDNGLWSRKAEQVLLETCADS